MKTTVLQKPNSVSGRLEMGKTFHEKLCEINSKKDMKMIRRMKCSVDQYPEYDFSFDLDYNLNPGLVNDLVKVQQEHGLKCYLGHVVVSGEHFWMPIRQFYVKPTRKITRYPGCVYINLVGASLIFSYGIITESAGVAKVGDVIPEDLEKYKKLGSIVWRDTVDSMAPKSLLMTVEPTTL